MFYHYSKFYVYIEIKFQMNLSDITQFEIDEETLFDKVL